MKESNFPVGNANIRQLQREILKSTKGQYMKESNTLVGNVAIEHLVRTILPDTKG